MQIKEAIDFRRPMLVRRMRLIRRKSGWIKYRERVVRDMTLPAPHWQPQVPKGVIIGGAWFEVINRHREIIYRRRINMPESVEVFAKDGTAHQIERTSEFGTEMELLVPYHKDAVELRLYYIPLDSLEKPLLDREGRPKPILVLDLTGQQRLS